MMVTHFDRAATQVFIEHAVGCHDPSTFHEFLPALKQFEFSFAKEREFSACVESDIQGQFERHCLALMQALQDLETGARLWPMVKLYYSIFYAIRAELHLAGFSLIRCRQIYIASGASQSKLEKFNNKEKGDHGISLEVMRKKIGEIDILQTQSIDGSNPYQWMKMLREVCQYKMRPPVEVTNFDPFFDPAAISFGDQVKMFLDDKDPLFCFDADYAALAIPIVRFRLTLKKIRSEGIALSPGFNKIADAVAGKSKGGSYILSYMR